MDANGCRGAMNGDGSVVVVVVEPDCTGVFETFSGIEVEQRGDVGGNEKKECDVEEKNDPPRTSLELGAT